MRPGLILVCGLVLGGGICFAVERQLAPLPDPTLTPNLDGFQQVSEGGVQEPPYDDGITWSWEEKVEPLDVIEFMKSLPYDEEREIDELTLRRLFEDIIQKAKDMMKIGGDGGDFEKTLRRHFLYFIPELEYWWPPYEEDFSKREVKFPIKVKKIRSNDGIDVLWFHLGRYADSERDVLVGFNDDGMEVRVYWEKYLPDKEGPPWIEILRFTISFEYKEAYFTRSYCDEEFTICTRLEGLKLYEMGNPEPKIDNTKDEPPLDLSGIGILFHRIPYDKWRIIDPALFQTFRGMINLIKLQLNLIDNGYELDKILWRDFFRFDYGVRYFGLEAELANVRRESTPDPDQIGKYSILMLVM